MESEEYTANEKKLLANKGRCDKHSTRLAEYICDTCISVLCVSCYHQHAKESEAHILYNYKEYAASILDKLTHYLKDKEEMAKSKEVETHSNGGVSKPLTPESLAQFTSDGIIDRGSEALNIIQPKSLNPEEIKGSDKVSIIREPEKSPDELRLNQIVSVLCKSIDNFRKIVNETGKSFYQAYINVPKDKWAKDPVLSEDKFKVELEKLKKTEDENDYLKLYVDGSKLLKQMGGVKPRMEAPFHLLKETLVKSAGNFSNRFIELCQVLSSPPVYPEEPKIQLTEAEREKRIAELLDIEEDKSLDKTFKGSDTESIKAEVSKYAPIFADYEKHMVIIFTEKDENELLNELSKEDLGSCKMVAIDSQCCIGVKSSQFLAEMIHAYLNITALYFSKY